jgi:hypothetical protein
LVLNHLSARENGWSSKGLEEGEMFQRAGNRAQGIGHGFGAVPPNSGAAEQDLCAFVDVKTEFTGILRYNGTIRIDGKVEGEIHTDGVLLIGKDAVIQAKISARSIVNRGTITGDVLATEEIRLLVPAVRSPIHNS